jgi:hypothetical protein
MAKQLPDGLFGFGLKFHLRDGFYFARAGDQVPRQMSCVNVVALSVIVAGPSN